MRVIIIVMDGVGIGEMPDAGEYGDEGSNTLSHIASSQGGLNLKNLESLGIGNLGEFEGIKKIDPPQGITAKLEEISKGKDTITGHWEMMGIIVEEPFPVYPQGFPDEIIKEFESRINRKIIGNRPASGTEIIKELGEEHLKTGKPIVYTSADSVFQIAAHEDIIPLEELYEMCRIAREILKGRHNVARVIARPFKGEKGNFIRTLHRKDFTKDPPHKTMLDILKENNHNVISIGKVYDMFNGRGFTHKYPMTSNRDGMLRLIEIMKYFEEGLFFITLTDFDTMYGHRNNPHGFAKALEEFDNDLSNLIDSLNNDDYLFITADHGCDPVTPSTDHSREYVPLLLYNKNTKGRNLGIMKGFNVIAITILKLFGIDLWKGQKSLLD